MLLIVASPLRARLAASALADMMHEYKFVTLVVYACFVYGT